MICFYSSQWFSNVLVSGPFSTFKKLLKALKNLSLYGLYLLIFFVLKIKTGIFIWEFFSSHFITNTVLKNYLCQLNKWKISCSFNFEFF